LTCRGFAYGLLDILNSKFVEVNGLSTNQGLGLHAAYFGAYAFGPSTVGRWTLLKLGFRATFIAGLSIYAVGTLIFWPAAVLSSFPAYVVCNFINGFGVSILEVAANPFVALCGPPRHAETRLNLSQGVQAIGTIVAPLLATKVLFRSVTDGGGLIDVQWAYLGIALFDVGLAVVFYYLPLPEATDDDFERVAEKRESANNATIFGFKVIYVTLVFAVFSQFCYVGAQETAGEAYQAYIGNVAPTSSLAPFDWQTIGHTVFAVGRFVTAGLGFIMKPRIVLLLLYFGMIVTAAVGMVVTGSAGIAMLTLYETFQVRS
jgi:fucose permease